MFTLEATPRYRCQCCDSALHTAPEYECSEWFLRCVSCGAKNLFVLTLSFIGWRPAERDFDLTTFDQQVPASRCRIREPTG
jgi:hypothetical protein